MKKNSLKIVTAGAAVGAMMLAAVPVFASAPPTYTTTLTSYKDRVASTSEKIHTDIKKDEQKIASTTQKAKAEVKADVQQAAKNLFKMGIVQEADRVNKLADMIDTVATKFQKRLAGATSTADVVTAQAKLADLNAKVSDARAQAQAATNEVKAFASSTSTTSDDGKAILKDAKAKIQTAHQDLISAGGDVKALTAAIVKVEVKGVVNKARQ